MTAPSIKGQPAAGKGAPCPTPVVVCSQLQAMDDYIVQLTNILGNLDRNKKVFMADTALNHMAASITTAVAAASK
jgi:hypothetical protein